MNMQTQIKRQIKAFSMQIKKVKLIKLIRTHKSLVENFSFNMENKLTAIFLANNAFNKMSVGVFSDHHLLFSGSGTLGQLDFGNFVSSFLCNVKRLVCSFKIVKAFMEVQKTGFFRHFSSKRSRLFLLNFQWFHENLVKDGASQN